MAYRYRVISTNLERDLANKLWSYGFAVLRGCASGSGVRKRVAPDIVAIKDGKVIVIEIKYCTKVKNLRIKKKQLSKLIKFCKRANAELYIAIKYKGENYKFIKIDKDVNTSDDLVILKENVLLNGLSIEQLLIYTLKT